ncbi:MAG: sigma-70 family RNA polymerase sigma factor [Candidatus Hydrogenedentes bacterium]|nr:sigma-70 family RNA polymerase sigma factor [Candidatus Hydrogenedentota bacterium]
MSDDASRQEEWVGAVLERYERALLNYALRFTGNLEAARDVVQDTFLQLCQADRARIDGHMAAWLYTVCRNRALDVRKKEGRMEGLAERQEQLQACPAPGPSVRAEQNETHAMVLAALETLPEREQEVFRLKFQDGLSYREIGQVLGMPHTTVSLHVHTALQTIRERLRACAVLTPERQGLTP